MCPMMPRSRLNHTGFLLLVLVVAVALSACSARLAAPVETIIPDIYRALPIVATPTAFIPSSTNTLTEQPSVTLTKAPTLTSTATVAPSPPDSTATPTLEPTVSDRVEWTEAGQYVGETRAVCGPVAGTHFAEGSRGQPTFLNVGVDYPSPQRFVVLIWGDERPNFPSAPESYYDGKTICARGEIKEYQGVFEVEVRSPEQIEIQ